MKHGAEWYKPSGMHYADLRDGLVAEGWATPDTYTNCFEPVPLSPGVYMFVLAGMSPSIQSSVGYVGMSRHLRARVTGHAIKRQMNEGDHWVQTWFKPMDIGAAREAEHSLIRRFNPSWNIQHRNRGVPPQ